MNYGLIGEKLGHSYSKEIHGYLADYDYTLREVAKEYFDTFATERDFKAINVTIPYKQTIIPYLYYIDESAKAIGAVNTVVNREGKLYGYNTDFYGLKMLIERIGVSLDEKKVAVLGTGGTSKTARAVAESLGAREVLRVSRSAKEGAISYDKLYLDHSDVEYIINTTPSGMYPNIFDIPVDISKFERLLGVCDAVYNPLRTPLVLAAREHGIAAEGGLYMLVAQAVRASEIFLGTTYSEDTILDIYNKILGRKENIVLIGMPASGKSTVGAIIAECLDRDIVDTDNLIVEKAGMEITEIFSKYGEKHFRDLESEAVRVASARNSVVIATGGGAILREENVKALREGGRLFFIDRPLEKLIPTDSRPLSSDREAITRRYNERYGIYRAVADVIIDADATPGEVADKIINS
ncbi:MAG: shikimate dehydrogenase [Clostridia bacterium]|nr:shikimate dehydrogenase [Clostridia bacterium]